jgi:hypothetical protein
MERLWSPAGATSRNQSQMGLARKRLKQADQQSVATRGNGSGAHGKVGADGSSPSEGSFQEDEAAANSGFFVAAGDTVEHLLAKEAAPSARIACGAGNGLNPSV